MSAVSIYTIVYILFAAELSLRISKMSIDMESIKRDKTDLVAIKDSQKERIKVSYRNGTFSFYWEGW